MNPYDFYITPEEYDRAAKIGIGSETLNRRVRQMAWDKERAITTPVQKHKPSGFYDKWVAIAKKNGISYSTFMSRINLYGWSLERAANEPLQDMRQAQKAATGHARKIPAEIIRMAESNGIAYHTMRARIIKGWDPKRAATEPTLTRSQIGRIGAHNTRAKYGDVGRVYLNTGRKHTHSRQIMTPDQYPRGASS